MKYRRAANVLGFVLLIALLIPFLIYAVPMTVGGDHSFVVLSGSMEPELSSGDVVIVGETAPETIEEGDVVTYVEPGSDGGVPVTHRVIGVEERSQGGGESGSETLMFETQGDANSEPDAEPVAGENVIGTVILTIPFIGYVTQFASTPTGFVLLVGLPVFLLLASEIWSLLRVTERESGSSPTSDTNSSSTGSPAQPTDTNEASANENEMAISLTDLTVTLGVLALLMPYAIYIALQLQTALSLTVAFATVFLTLGLGTVRVFAQPNGRAPQTAPTDSSAAPSVSDQLPGEKQYFGFWNESFAWSEEGNGGRSESSGGSGDESSGENKNRRNNNNSNTTTPKSETAHTVRETNQGRSPPPSEESGA